MKCGCTDGFYHFVVCASVKEKMPILVEAIERANKEQRELIERAETKRSL